MTNLIDSHELNELIREPNIAEVMTESALGLDLRGTKLSESQSVLLGDWIARQSIPILGLLDDKSSVSDCLDLVIDTEQECLAIMKKINEYPMACAVLVQITRASANLTFPHALSLESLGYATLQSGAEFSRWLSKYEKENQQKSQYDLTNPILLEREGRELRIILNTPVNRNALSVPMRDGLSEAFKIVSMDDSITRVYVSANGPCFSAGGDLTEFGSATDFSEAHAIRKLRMPAQYLIPQKHRYTAFINGACIGAGIEIFAFSSCVQARRDAVFRLPEIEMGLIPGAGGCVSIPRRIGRQRMNYFAISGKQITADEAMLWGLVDKILD